MLFPYLIKSVSPIVRTEAWPPPPLPPRRRPAVPPLRSGRRAGSGISRPSCPSPRAAWFERPVQHRRQHQVPVRGLASLFAALPDAAGGDRGLDLVHAVTGARPPPFNPAGCWRSCCATCASCSPSRAACTCSFIPAASRETICATTPDPLATNSKIFHFRDQGPGQHVLDLAGSVPIGTLWECLLLWGYANGYATLATFTDNPFRFAGLMLVIPLWSGFHFYWFHRLLHVGPIYRRVHSWHHKNVNVGPWSGHAMHPLEHAGLYSDLIIYFLVASHPIHVIFNAMLHTIGGPVSHIAATTRSSSPGISVCNWVISCTSCTTASSTATTVLMKTPGTGSSGASTTAPRRPTPGSGNAASGCTRGRERPPGERAEGHDPYREHGETMSGARRR